MRVENNSGSASWGGDGCIFFGRNNHFVSSVALRVLDQIFQLWWINTHQEPSSSSAVIGDLECEAGTRRSLNTADTFHSRRNERKTLQRMAKSASNWNICHTVTDASCRKYRFMPNYACVCATKIKNTSLNGTNNGFKSTLLAHRLP